MIYRLSLLPWRLGLYWGLDCAHCLILFFLLRDAMIAWHMLSLCSSVCLSATSHNLTKMAKHITMHAAPHSSLETNNLDEIEIPMGRRSWGCQWRGGWKICGTQQI